jgi:regulatory protein
VKISKIAIQKKNKDRFSIYIDGEFRFGLSQEFIIKHDLHVGAEITPEKIDELLHQDEKHKIMKRAFKILHYRERSSKELKDRLLRAGFDQLLVDDVIQELIADNTIDDERFARAFVKDYTSLKPKGNIFIINELKKRGISLDIIMDLIKNRDEKRMIKTYINKKFDHYDLKEPKTRQKLIKRLLRRGYTPNAVYSEIDQYTHVHDTRKGEHTGS